MQARQTMNASVINDRRHCRLCGGMQESYMQHRWA